MGSFASPVSRESFVPIESPTLKDTFNTVLKVVLLSTRTAKATVFLTKAGWKIFQTLSYLYQLGGWTKPFIWTICERQIGSFPHKSRWSFTTWLCIQSSDFRWDSQGQMLGFSNPLMPGNHETKVLTHYEEITIPRYCKRKSHVAAPK